MSRSAMQRLGQTRAVPLGSYVVDIHINQRYVTSGGIDVVAGDDGNPAVCVPLETLSASGVDVLPGAATASSSRCVIVERAVPGASSDLDMARLRLNLQVPQNRLRQQPRGYVNPADLDDGESIGFVNYLANHYRLSGGGMRGADRSSSYLALNGGVNVGLWQFRHQSSASHMQGSGTRWNSIRSYVQRPIHAAGSQLTLGQTFTTGRLFSGLRFNGIVMETDERMLPDSLRGFAPVVRGVAITNARVSIRQNGIEIYQTTVAPGPFEIADLYPTSFSGDLNVEVQEADGSVQSFTVPYAALPDSLREGSSRYTASMGRTRDAGEDSPFVELTYQRGLSNAFTLNSGARLARGYQAVLLGGVYNASLGAIGTGVTFSRADLPHTGYLSGWMSQLSYSRAFQATGTVVTLAGYRYSSSGYRDLSDVLGVRALADSRFTWQSSTYRQRNRLEFVVSQTMEHYGNVFLSASTQDYRDGRSRDTQLQLGYNKGFSNGMNLNVTATRLRYGGYANYAGWRDSREIRDVRSQDGNTMIAVTLSFPLGSPGSPRAASVNTTLTRDTRGSASAQSTVSGMLDEAQTLSYTAGVSHDDYERRTTSWSGSLNKRSRIGTLGGSASAGSGYRQMSLSGQGAIALHRGGVTLGPYLGNTFALVEAPGASGARVLNAQDAVVDSRGYALVPAMTAYRYNYIALDPEGMSTSAELEEGEKRVAPYAGAAVKVQFRTRQGVAVLITARLPDGRLVPFGAEAADVEDRVIGLAGQHGQVYARVPSSVGQVRLRWGDLPDDGCVVHYDVSDADPALPLVRLPATCHPITAAASRSQ